MAKPYPPRRSMFSDTGSPLKKEVTAASIATASTDRKLETLERLTFDRMPDGDAERKDGEIKVRVESELIAKFKAAAEGEKMTLSEWVRQACLYRIDPFK